MKIHSLDESARGHFQQDFDEEDDFSSNEENSSYTRPRRRHALPASLITNVLLSLIILCFAFWPASDLSAAIWCKLRDCHRNHLAKSFQHQPIKRSNTRYTSSTDRLRLVKARTRANRTRNATSGGWNCTNVSQASP